MLGNAFTIFSVGEPSLGSWEIVLVVCVLDVSKELTSLSHPKESTTQQVTGGAHLCWVDVSLGKHATSKKGGDLESIDAVVLGFSSMNGFHVEGMAEDESDTLLSAEVGKPIPGEDTLHGDDEVLTKRGDRIEENMEVGR